MKRRKVFLVLLLSLIMLVVPCTSAVSGTNDNSSKLTAEEIKVMKAQTPAIDLGVSIKQNFEEKDYGGMYIDENNNLNVFLLSNNKAAKIAASAEAAKDSSNKVIFRHADYSLQELKAEMDRLYDYSVETGIYCSMSLDESINKIKITLSDPDILNEIATDPNMFDITDEDEDLERVKCSTKLNCGSAVS